MDFLSKLTDSATAGMATVAAAVVGIALGLQKGLQAWATTKRDITVTDGETQLVHLLRQEMSRLAEANEKLMKNVQDLHGQVLVLQGENAELKTLVETLTAKVNAYGG